MKNKQQIVPILFFSLCSGCFWATTKHEGEKLRLDVDRIDDIVSKQEEDNESSIKKLKETLKEASDLLARNSADLGAQFDQLEQENARLTGLVMEAKRYTDEVFGQVQGLETRLAKLEERLGIVENKTNLPTAKSADDLWSEGEAAYKSKNYSDARDIFRVLVIKFPSHSRADDAQFYRGETYFAEKDYKSSLKEYQATFEKFPTSDWANDAMFKAGESAENLKWCTDARAYFGLLRQKHPKSSFANDAKKKDTVLKQRKGKTKYCQS